MTSQVFGWMVFLHCLIGIGEGVDHCDGVELCPVQRPDLVASRRAQRRCYPVSAGLYQVIAALGIASFLVWLGFGAR